MFFFGEMEITKRYLYLEWKKFEISRAHNLDRFRLAILVARKLQKSNEKSYKGT